MPRIAHWAWYPLGTVLRFLGRNGKRIAITVAGFALIAVGLILLFLPGPGLLLVIAGLAVLATEYVWAQRALNYAKRRASDARDRVLRRPRRVDGNG